MNAPLKQHVIDPEICIRCHTCEEACPIGAITHDEMNVVVDASKCNFCMDCISPCPTGSIDNWRVVATPYSLEEQLSWMELPPQEDLGEAGGDSIIEALDDEAAALLAEAHKGAGGRGESAGFRVEAERQSVHQGEPRHRDGAGQLPADVDDAADSDVRHIILDLGSVNFPVLEGQSVGVTPPGTDANGRPHHMRLYSVSSPRDGERPNTNNLSLTVKREEHGPCSNYLCDLAKGARMELTGPYGSTFLMPNDPQANLLMICTGTGSAPFRAFTMRRQRTRAANAGGMTVFFGARSPDSLPYFGPLNKVPDEVLKKHLVFSRLHGSAKEYVQDRMRAERHALADALRAEPTRTSIFAGSGPWRRASSRRSTTLRAESGSTGQRSGTKCAAMAAITSRPIDGGFSAGASMRDLHLSASECIITHNRRRQRVHVMSQQVLKDLVGSIAALLGRKALKPDPAGPREEHKSARRMRGLAARMARVLKPSGAAGCWPTKPAAGSSTRRMPPIGRACRRAKSMFSISFRKKQPSSPAIKTPDHSVLGCCER